MSLPIGPFLNDLTNFKEAMSKAEFLSTNFDMMYVEALSKVFTICHI